MKLMRIAIAVVMTLPLIVLDFAQVLVEGPGFDPQGPNKMLAPQIWYWALR